MLNPVKKDSGRTDVAKRAIPASPEEIFSCFCDSDTLLQWLPPKGMIGRAHEYDFRQGGFYRIELEYPKGDLGRGKTTGQSDISKGCFVEIVANRKIRQTVEFEGSDLMTMMMTWTFYPVKDGTSVTVTAENVPSDISAEDHQEGMTSSLDNLAAFLGGSRTE